MRSLLLVAGSAMPVRGVACGVAVGGMQGRIGDQVQGAEEAVAQEKRSYYG